MAGLGPFRRPSAPDRRLNAVKGSRGYADFSVGESTQATPAPPGYHYRPPSPALTGRHFTEGTPPYGWTPPTDPSREGVASPPDSRLHIAASPDLAPDGRRMPDNTSCCSRIRPSTEAEQPKYGGSDHNGTRSAEDYLGSLRGRGDPVPTDDKKHGNDRNDHKDCHQRDVHKK